MIQDIYPHKLNNQYHPDQKPDADSIILYFTQEVVLCQDLVQVKMSFSSS